MNSLFSIIIPTLNAKNDLIKTLDSIQEQAFPNVEIIVVDGDSKDGTPDLIKADSRISKYLIERDRGIYDAMNKGLAMASGRYLQFLNAGDILYSSSCYRAVAKAIDEQNPDLVYGKIATVDSSYREIEIIRPLGFNDPTIKKFGTASVNHQAIFIKRECAPKFSDQYVLKGELNWYIDILKRHPNLNAFFLDQTLIKYRLGGLGSQKYWLNTFEWIKVTFEQYGLSQVLLNSFRYIKFIRTHMKNRMTK